MGRKKNIFIVVEGLSGCGKTRITKALSKKLNAIYFKTPPPPLIAFRDIADKKFGIEDRYSFYLAGSFLASEQIKKILERKTVICDRYIYTTLAFHAARGLKVHKISQLKNLLTPDITFLVTCDEDIRRERMNKRGLSHNDKLEIKFKTDRKFLKEYEKFPVKYLENNGRLIDTIAEAMRQIGLTGNKKIENR